jgi:adenosylhomocysteine nucleosidase
MWRSIFRQWAQQTAAEAFQSRVQELAQNAEEHPPAPPRPIDLGVVFALASESGGLEDRLTDKLWIRGEAGQVCIGSAQERTLGLIVTGPGEKSARVGTEALILGHRPRWIVAAGFAGALSDHVQPFDIVIPDRLLHTGGRSLQVGLTLEPGTPNAAGLHVGPLVSVSELAHGQQQRQELARRHQALAVDLESFAVAEVCREYQVPMWVVKIITDGVDQQLPREIAYLMKPRKWTEKLGAVTAAIWNRPASIKDMWRLNEIALRASDRLAEFLLSMVRSLP